MKAEDVIKNFSLLKYTATDGKEYFIKEKYPLIFQVGSNLQNEEKEVFALDTGGEMSQSCDFFTAKITKGILYRRDPEGGNTFRLYARNITLLGQLVL